ncbi:MAG TPA: ChaN family lipoprotein [Polyangiaceae bacterium]|nr:ChaN family lipoprotein [Polyangiaceae bacterium]
MRTWFILGALSSLACVSQKAPTSAATAGLPPPVGAAADVRPVEAWLTTLDRDSVLVGKIWDVKAGAFVEPRAMLEHLAKARFILLGERHDNPDHHRLQGRVLGELVKAGRRPALVLEMLEVEQQPLVEQYSARGDASAAGFGAALSWEKTSWPPFKEYQPIFEAAFAAKLPIFAGNVAQADAKALVRQGTSALSAERVKELRLEPAFPAPLEATLVDELRASHCGQLPENLLGPMALAQHARDAQMAKVLADAGAQNGAVLISGGGHARLDRGVPYYLAFDAPGARVMSVSLREVRHGDVDPTSYAGEEGPFDYVWFTPRGSDEDPCAAFKSGSK